MMETTTFDTHRLVKRLLSEGFTEGQAEVLTEEYQQLLASHLENLSTKQDLEKVNTRLEKIDTRLDNCATKQDLEKVNTRLEKIETRLDNCTTKQELTEHRSEVRVAIAEVKRDMVALKDRLNLFMGGIFLVLGWIVFMLMRMG